MKYWKFFCKVNNIQSLPVRGAWIEMARSALRSCCSASLPVRGAWIEIFFPGA